MATGSVIVNNGKKILLNRTYKSAPDYLCPSLFKVGVSNDTPSATDTNLTNAVPIADGTVCDDGDNQFTGSSGGDNSTDNTDTYKEGAGASDATAQNLIANDTNALKIWTIANLAANGTNASGTQYVGLWLYIKDATALAKFKTSGTCLEIKLGKDSSNYYSKTYTAADLATGWNWLSSNTELLNEWTETGTVDAAIDTFLIEITTNNATDTFAEGDVVYDLLRQWEAADSYITFVSGYPSINETNFETEIRCQLLTTQANGFPLDGASIWNNDSTKLMHSEDTLSSESKSSTDQFTYIIKDRII